MTNTLKTIKASGSLKHPGSINETEQTYRDRFKISPVGGLVVSDERGTGSAQIDDVRADDVLELLLDNDVTLFTRRDDYERDFQHDSSRAANGDELAIGSISLGPPSRGLSSWAVKLLDVFRVDVSDKAGLALCKKFEKSSVARPDLFKISQSAPLKLTPARFTATHDASKPVLVFIHGTASSTEGSFGGLWEDANIELLNQLAQHYPGHMFALEHWSLSQNPIRNALDLVAALPDNARVHLVSHSRGGMVGELICRAMTGDDKEPFLQTELDNYNTRATAITASLKEGKTAARNAYKAQISELKLLNDLLIRKNIQVDKFVRVACPARGTTLASERLDRWLSVFFNVVGLIPALRATPYYSLLKNFIRALVKTRTKAHLLPGLEAQMPGSPLVALLNNSTRLLSSELSVISGDTEREGLLGQIAMLLPDRFYDSDHDLVVNTPSMYGGAERRGGGRYYFDQGDDVSHFNYFRNDPTATRVIKGLLLNDAALDPYFTRQLPAVSAPIASRSINVGSAPQPIVFLLPGIMGSELDAGKSTIWAKKLKLAFGGLSKLEISDQQVSSSGLIGDSYQALFDCLGRDNDVIPFHYDWRTTLEEAASRLAGEIKAACKQAAKHNQPVSIIAHSLGGLLVRLMMAQHSDAWNAMLRHPSSRFIMLGTPNGGSFSIPRMLFGHDKLLKGIALLDLFHSQAQLLNIIREYPGVLLLLPYGHLRFDFFKNETWQELAHTDSRIFAAPLKAQLVKAAKIRSLINSRPLALEANGRILYIAGHADSTPADLTVVHNTVVFKGTAQGDGRVPWASGIPTGIPTWYMAAQHGDLANHEPAFDAIKELLRTGHTERLPDRQPISARGELELFDIKPDEVDVYPNDRDLQAWALGSSSLTVARQDTAARKIKLHITHGNIAFSLNPVMVGHYENDGIFSAEKYLDRCLEGRLSRCYELGIYPDKLNSAELIINSGGHLPAGALIVGLGKVGGLTVSTLTNTIRNAMHRYAFDMQNTSESSQIAVTSLLIGASASGLPIQDALMAILQGVMQANQSLRSVYPEAQLSINELQIMELWEDRAILTTQAANYLFSVNDELQNSFNYEQRLEQVDGGQYRAYHEEEAGWWNRLLIEETDDGGMSFHSVTDKARTEKRLLTTDRKKVDQFLQEATASTWSKRSLSRTLFETLIPYELKEATEKLDDTVLIVDESTARYPWELLEDRLSYSGKPLAVQSRLIRQLASVRFRQDPKMSSSNQALVIGEPHLSNTDLWPPLPGAAEEAKMTAFALENDGGFKVKTRINTNAANIIEALHEQSYRILHFAGHGVHNFNLEQALQRIGQATDFQATDSRVANENASGMVIGNGTFLEANDIGLIRRVPELVFINCCHLGDTSSAQTQSNFPGLAANLAVAFIRMGARAVVAAGWAVDDLAAKTFADIFYASMIKGKCFGDAVYQARTTIFDRFPQLNTWGAYQCYGDPLYKFDKRGTTSTYVQQPAQTPGDLIDQLQTVRKHATTATDSYRASLLGRVNDLLNEHRNQALVKWWARGDVCSAIAQTFRELDRFEKAIEWYEKAAACEDATITLRAYEQYARLLVLHATAVAFEQPTKRHVQAAQTSIRQAVEIFDDLDKVTANIHGGVKASSTKLACLRGFAYKSLARIYRHSDVTPDLVVDALKTMRDHYKDACDTYDNIERYQRYNPYTSYFIATILLNVMQEKDYGLSPEGKRSLEKLKRSCFNKDRADPGSRTLIPGIECELVLKIADQTLAKHARRLAKKYLTAKNRATSPREFRPAIDHIEFLIELTRPENATTTSRKKREFRQALLKTNQALLELRQVIA